MFDPFDRDGDSPWPWDGEIGDFVSGILFKPRRGSLKRLVILSQTGLCVTQFVFELLDALGLGFSEVLQVLSMTDVA